MKDKIQSLLGIEMSLYGWEFKPIILLFGVLFFMGLFSFLCLSWIYFRIKLFILDQYKSILEEHRLCKRKKDNKYKY